MSKAVIDQPGIRITILGLVLSFFLGYGLKSQIAQSRVEYYLNRAIERLHGDFSIDYEKAHVNLSKWGLPFPVLEISNIRLSPKGACQNSQIYIDELEIPISMSAIFGLNNRIPKIRLRNIELRIVDADKCASPVPQPTMDPAPDKKVTPKLKAEASMPPPLKSQPEIKDVFSRNTKAELNEIYIEKLKIIFGQKPEQPLVLKNVNVELKYAANKLTNIILKSKFNAIKDLKSDVYYANANLNVMSKTNSDGNIETILNVEGKLLDGDVQFFTHYVSGDPKLNYELDLDKVSAKALQPLVPGEGQSRVSLFDRLPMSVSFKNSGELFWGKNQRLESTLKKLAVNIDNAALKAGEIRLIIDGGKTVVSPFDFLIDGLPLSRLKSVDFFRGRLDSFESLGVISGKLSYQNDSNVRFDGLLRGLEVVFSNRGRRDLQNIDEMNLHLRRQKNYYSLEANSLVVGGEKLDGVLTAAHDTEKNTTQANLKISGKILSGKIWDQFTFVEQSPKVDVNWIYHKSENESYVLKMRVDSLELPGVLFSNVGMDLNQTSASVNSKGNLNLNIRPQHILTNEKFLENEFVTEVLKSSIGIKGQVFAGERTSITLSGQDWRTLNFNLESAMSEVQSKQPLHLSLKGSVVHMEGMKSKLLLVQKNQSYKFDFLGNVNGQLSIIPEAAAK